MLIMEAVIPFHLQQVFDREQADFKLQTKLFLKSFLNKFIILRIWNTL